MRVARPCIGWIVGLTWPCVALAEVMDKEPSLRTLWTNALLIGVAGAVAWAWRTWSGVIMSLVALWFALSVVTRFTDPWVGPAILAEAGRGYLVQSYAAVLACVALHTLGASWRLRRSTRSRIERAHGTASK